MPTFTAQPTKDSLLRSGATAGANYGISADLLTSNVTRAVIQYDLSSIPSNAAINSAAIYFYQDATGAALAWIVSVYAIMVGNANWPEGTKNGGAGGAGDCCWNFKDQGGAGTAWAGGAGLPTAGTDYVAAALGTFSGNRSDANGTEYSMVLPVAIVKTWLGAANQNYGMLLIPSTTVGGLASRQHGTVTWWPKIVVEWRMPYAPLRRIR